MTHPEPAAGEFGRFTKQRTPQERMFPRLPPQSFERLAAHGRLRRVDAGELLVEAGVPVTHLFLVESGRLDPTPFGTHRFSLDETMSAYDVFADAATTHALKVVLSAHPVRLAAVAGAAGSQARTA